MEFETFKDEILQLAANESIDTKAIQNRLAAHFKEINIPTVEYNQRFVVRCSMNEPGEIFRNVSRCSYHPDPRKIRLQRCNYPTQQVFYCSGYSDTYLTTTSATCVLETAWEHITDHTQQRSYCTLSGWRCARELRLLVLPFCAISCEKNKTMQVSRERSTSLLNAQPNAEVAIKSLEFISNVFAERNNKKLQYRISSAFYNMVCFGRGYHRQDVDGLIYPSANTEGAGINMVLNKNLIDLKILWCTVATMYSITRIPNNPMNLFAATASNDSEVDDKGNLKFSYIL